MFGEILAIYLIIGLGLGIKAAGSLTKSGQLTRNAKTDIVYEVFFWVVKYLFKGGR